MEEKRSIIVYGSHKAGKIRTKIKLDSFSKIDKFTSEYQRAMLELFKLDTENFIRQVNKDYKGCNLYKEFVEGSRVLPQAYAKYHKDGIRVSTQDYSLYFIGIALETFKDVIADIKEQAMIDTYYLARHNLITNYCKLIINLDDKYLKGVSVKTEEEKNGTLLYYLNNESRINNNYLEKLLDIYTSLYGRFREARIINDNVYLINNGEVIINDVSLNNNIKNYALSLVRKRDSVKSFMEN